MRNLGRDWSDLAYKKINWRIEQWLVPLGLADTVADTIGEMGTDLWVNPVPADSVSYFPRRWFIDVSWKEEEKTSSLSRGWLKTLEMDHVSEMIFSFSFFIGLLPMPVCVCVFMGGIYKNLYKSVIENELSGLEGKMSWTHLILCDLKYSCQ